MSILIKGMEIPKENDYTIVIVYGDGVVTEYHEDYWIRGADGEKQIGTAIPVPEHGRLIDADALLERFEKEEKAADEHGRDFSFSFKSCGENCTEWWAVQHMLMDAPTIIPAEEGET